MQQTACRYFNWFGFYELSKIPILGSRSGFVVVVIVPPIGGSLFAAKLRIVAILNFANSFIRTILRNTFALFINSDKSTYFRFFFISKKQWNLIRKQQISYFLFAAKLLIVARWCFDHSFRRTVHQDKISGFSNFWRKVVFFDFSKRRKIQWNPVRK